MSKKIVIIGGTSGIGYSTAEYLKEEGYDVVISGRNKPNVKELRYVHLDVRDESSIKNFFESEENIDGLVYAAGITIAKKNIQEFDLDEYNKIIMTNVTGLLLCLKYAYSDLRQSMAKVVVVNSLAARTYSQFSGLEYTISKSALSGLVKQLSMDFAVDNVLINSVFPGMTLTPMLIENVKEDVLSKIQQGIPLGRIANPLEIAKAIEFLISEKNTYITGSGIDINGGQYLNA